MKNACDSHTQCGGTGKTLLMVLIVFLIFGSIIGISALFYTSYHDLMERSNHKIEKIK